MTGDRGGSLCKSADVPPIIHDFQAECKRFGLKTGSTLEAEATLSIFSNPKHREQSMFMSLIQI